MGFFLLFVAFPKLFLPFIPTLPFSFGSSIIWISFHFDKSLGEIKLIADPTAPALPVLPIRCIKSSANCGKSKLITFSIWGTSNPRAAISVATKILNFWLRKSFITLSRLFCLKFPLSDWDLNPSLERFFAILSVPCFVFTKIKIEPFLLFISSINLEYFTSCLISKTSWSTLVATVLVAPIETLSGLVKYFKDSFSISFGIVAENNNVCLSLGTNLRILSIWTPKPISSIRSVSSKTRNLASLNFNDFRSKWSLILPGVPTIILGLFFNCLSWRVICSPPIKQAVLMWFKSESKLVITSITCLASSLVGVRTNAIDLSAFSNDSINGILNAAVFPVPVCAEPRISFPCIPIGIDCAWIGVGLSKLIFFKAFLIPSDKLRLSKLFI